MSWMLLRDLLSGVNKYSAGIGRIWLAVVFIFRLLVYMVVAERVWKDEEKDFQCNIRQPGCENVCFDYFFPISQVRLWALQLTVVSIPSLLVVLHVAYHEGQEKRNNKKFYVGPSSMDGGMWYTYVLSLVFKTGFESGFLVLFYKLYDGFRIPHPVKCDVRPCPNTVDCFISKATEKKIFLYFLLVASCLCIVLNITELSYLVFKNFVKCCLQRYAQNFSSSASKCHNLEYVTWNEINAPNLLQKHNSDCSRSIPQKLEVVSKRSEKKTVGCS